MVVLSEEVIGGFAKVLPGWGNRLRERHLLKSVGRNEVERKGGFMRWQTAAADKNRTNASVFLVGLPWEIVGITHRPAQHERARPLSSRSELGTKQRDDDDACSIRTIVVIIILLRCYCPSPPHACKVHIRGCSR